MNIAIDVSPLESEHKSRGTGVYTRELVDGLIKSGSLHHFAFIHKGQKVPENTDLIHYPYFDPFFLTLPFAVSKPVVITVHDLIPLVFPDKFPRGIRGTIKWEIQKSLLKKSRRILTDSESSKKDIHTITGIEIAKIDVIPLAPSSQFYPKTKPEVKTVRLKYGLPAKFILYVGDVNWNKNVTGLLEAYAQVIRGKGYSGVPLVLVGRAFQDEKLEEVLKIKKFMRSLNITDAVIMPGFIPDNELADIYSSATCLVMPSFYEGFGFPVLEAMACGCPVITSQASSLHEIAGPAVLIKPDNTQQIADEIRNLVHLPENKRTSLVKESLTWVKQFTWKKVTESTIASYERAVV